MRIAGSGQSWQWVKVRLSGQSLPAGWQAQSPTMVKRGRWLWLHTPIKKEIENPKPALEQVATNPKLRVCSVDLNIGNSLAVCAILQADGTVVATRFIKGGAELHDRRKSHLGRIAQKRRETGLIAEGERDNQHRWRKLRRINQNEAHRVSCRIVEFAVAHGASIVVFEHLDKLKPVKGRFSRRSNEKRAYWLKGKIQQYARYKAWAHRIITCKVSPANTSRDCSGCGYRPVARYRAGEAPVEYGGGLLFICPHCLKRGNADENAAINSGFRLFERSYKHLSESLSSKDKGIVGGKVIAAECGKPAAMGRHCPLHPVLRRAPREAATLQGLLAACTPGCLKKPKLFRLGSVTKIIITLLATALVIPIAETAPTRVIRESA